MIVKPNPSLLQLAARSDATVDQLVEAFRFYAEGGRGFIPFVAIGLIDRLHPAADRHDELLRLARFGLEAARAKNALRTSPVSEADYQRVIDRLSPSAS